MSTGMTHYYSNRALTKYRLTLNITSYTLGGGVIVQPLAYVIAYTEANVQMIVVLLLLLQTSQLCKCAEAKIHILVYLPRSRLTMN